MFVIEDEKGNPLIEVRRNPASGDSSFSGLLPQSTHIRLSNWVCYWDEPINFLREFLIKHDYIFKRIFRIDVCYDFERFDSGDLPEKFARRYVEHRYSKINQCNLATRSKDNWSDFEWETLSWGSFTSMVSTKLYNKTKELAANSHDKPYIKSMWFQAGLIDSPISMVKKKPDGTVYKPSIWRIEFSLRSGADHWLIIEDISGKRTKKKAIPHNLSLFDSRDKLWQRFQDLAFHYFRFKVFEPGVRKDRCKDKVLFYFDRDHTFTQVKQLPPPSKPDNEDAILRRRLQHYRTLHADAKIRKAVDVILEALDDAEARRLTPNQLRYEIQALQAAIRLRMGGDERSAVEIASEIKQLLVEQSIF